ncbi:MAG: hypothetical protein RMK57_09900 [Bryobacterales bacterium]|nr:hypothetical protein [Bryobacteraceae bacterium]MDW8354831.1 hypothetical protein [Bryobacterales bacterium]
MSDLVEILLPFVAALGSGIIVFLLTQARMQVVLAREREVLAETQALLRHHLKAAEERIKAAEAEARRGALDEFLADVRVEERHYLRRASGPERHRRFLVLQERIYFRNIPLSNWIERELPVEDGTDIERLIEAVSVFPRVRPEGPENGPSGRTLPTSSPIPKQLRAAL